MTQVLKLDLLEKKCPVEELRGNFDSIMISLKLLSKTIERIDNSADIVNTAAFLHGFINTYISNVIKKQIERTK